MHSRFSLFIFIILVSQTMTSCAPIIVAGATTGTIVAHDRRTLGAFIDDVAIESKIKNLVGTDENLGDSAHVKIVSMNGIVLLTGEVATVEQRTAIISKARSVGGVRRIVNEIRIAPPSTLASRSKDTWLTGKVKTKLATNEHVDSTRIKVVTVNRVVYLMGLVTEVEGQSATDTVRDTDGITRIVKLFEYID